MENRKIYSVGGEGQVFIPSSKSDVHRILIAAALSDQPTEVTINGISKDIKATMECLAALGSEIVQISEYVWKVEPAIRKNVVNPLLNCGESGSTLRFLLPVAAALTGQFEIRAEGRLPERPIGELTSQMKLKGCSFSAEQLPFRIEGQLTGGKFSLPGNVSSQYITGLLLALPLLEEDSEICLETELESKAYVEMTLATLEQFGIIIEVRANGYFIPGRQTYRSPGSVMAEGDWSNAAFFLAAGALKGPVTCTGLKQDTKQADFAILRILEAFGAGIEYGEQITVTSGKLKGIEIDASEIPDLVPILSVVAAGAEGKTRIYNAGRLRIKESDRLAAMCDNLSRVGVKVQELPEEMVIEGLAGGHGQPAKVSGYNDHRIVMAMTVAAIAAGIELTIEETEAVQKSFPEFFDCWEKIQGSSAKL